MFSVNGFIAELIRPSSPVRHFLKPSSNNFGQYTRKLSDAKFWKTEGGIDRFLFVNPDLRKVEVHAELDYNMKVICITEGHVGDKE